MRPENDFPTAIEAVRKWGYESWQSQLGTFVQFGAMLSVRSPMFLRQATGSSQIPEAGPARDRALDDMRKEIGERFLRWKRLNWVLRFTTDPDNAVPTGDHCIGADGSAPTLEEGFYKPDTTLFFPVSRDMCLFGSQGPLSPATSRFHYRDLERLRGFVLKQAQIFVVSTVPLF